MRPYGLRQTIRCPKKYGDSAKERSSTLALNHDLDSEWEQSEQRPQKPLDDRYIRNAAVLPDIILSTPEQKTSTSAPVSQPAPLMIHGFTVPEYQQTFRSVVDPLLYGPCGKLMAYSLELGRSIKERLFEELAYPTLQISEQPDGQVEVVERFCVLRPTPFIDVDS